jgi:hypothetical protein
MIQRFFALVSLAWLALVVIEAHGISSGRNLTPEEGISVTASLIVVNFVMAIWELGRHGRSAITPNLVQVPLFCLLQFQWFQWCPGGYEFDSEPVWHDWVLLTFAHLVRAVDVVDAVDELGIFGRRFLQIEAIALTPRLLLVWMHLSIDLAIGGSVARFVWNQYRRHQGSANCRMFGRCCHHRRRELWRRLCKWARRFAALCCIALVALCAVQYNWSPLDCLLWPLANVVKTLDIADAYQIFRWKIHSIDHAEFWPWLSLLAIAFRLIVGLYVASWFIDLWLVLSQGKLATLDTLIDELQNESPRLKTIAARSLGRLGEHARAAVPLLCEAISDPDAEVRLAAANALSAIQPQQAPVHVLKRGLDFENVRLATIVLLGELRGQAGSAVPELMWFLTKGQSVDVREEVVKALGQIGWRANVALSALEELAQSAPSPAIRQAAHAAAQAIRADDERNMQRLHDSTFHWFWIPQWRRC